MKRQEKIEQAASAVTKCMQGGVLTDQEIKCGIEIVEESLQFFNSLGDRYYLIRADLARKRTTLEEFDRARRWDNQCNS